MMLKQNQINYLKTVPKDRITHVVDFDPKTQTTAQEIISEVQNVLPLVKIYYIGSSALGIAGENDIDLTIMAEANFDESLKILKESYGTPEHENPQTRYVKWEFARNSFPVELHLGAFMTPDLQEQLDTQKVLEGSVELRLEYEKIKRECNGLPWIEYLTRKYEFWNRILGIK
ncbi:MAG TPA: GrpB family protein [Candidatus Paceibacterota bacterium]|jgi:GrpB-like predicted nucleotidyltransferase (UPF0157 family)|nr:GrpB family protein [Candidatus Paceibacterota bacterium]